MIVWLTRVGTATGSNAAASSHQALLLDSLRSERDRLAVLVAAGCASPAIRDHGDVYHAFGSVPTVPATLPPAPVTDGYARKPQQLATMLDAAVVLVISRNAHGSGFFVGPDLIATNSHVVERAGKDGIWVTNRILGQVLRASVVATTPSSTVGAPDFALLRLAAPAKMAMPLALASDVGRLAPVVAAGYPGLVMSTDPRLMALLKGKGGDAPETVLSPGEVSVTQPQANGIKLVIHTADISPGNSGGPLVDRCGRVVGINTFVSKSSEYTGRVLYALSASDLASFLNSNHVPFAAGNGACAAGVLR